MQPDRNVRSSLVSDAANPVRDPHDGDAGGLDYRALTTMPGVLTFETAPLDEDLEVVGPIAAEMYIVADKPDTDLWVKLLDVAPDGTAYNLMSTGLDVVRASYRNRTASGSCSRGSDLSARPRHAHDRQPVPPRASDPRRGHGRFAPNLSCNLHTGRLEQVSSATAVARIAVHTGPDYGSRLVLPVVR